MSISGPCLWLSSLSPPVSSHLSAITNHLSTATWNGGQTQLRPRAELSRPPWEKDSLQDAAIEERNEPSNPPEMQPIALKAENAFAAGAASTGGSSAGRFPGAAGMPLNDVDHRIIPGSDTLLSRAKLEKFNRSEPLLGRSISKESTPEAKASSRRDETVEPEKDNGEMTVTSSDDGCGSSVGGEHQKPQSGSKSEKKKMKRFRLTHNQTRFLMSEFTRQAHPDAAHRERLSREIPGLTPRQVQVWFQNRRAKLKRLTSNDRERMLKSRALPDDFDTTQVLRTPFDGKSGSEQPVLLTDGLQRPNDEDYVISPMSSASTNGNYFSPATIDRGSDQFHQSGPMANRAPPSISGGRGAFPFARSSSFSETSFNGLQLPNRFSRPTADPMGHMPYGRHYGIPRPANGMVVGYDQRPLEGSVSPTNQQESPASYNVDCHNSQGYQSHLNMPKYSMEMNSHFQNRQIPSLHSLPVTDHEYRPFSYDHHPYPLNTAIPFTQANSSSLSLPASFPSSDAAPASHGAAVCSPDDRMNPPQILDPLRSKFGAPAQPFEYANYL